MNWHKLSIIVIWIIIPFIAYLDVLRNQLHDYRYYIVVSTLEIMLITGGYLYRDLEYKMRGR